MLSKESNNTVFYNINLMMQRCKLRMPFPVYSLTFSFLDRKVTVVVSILEILYRVYIRQGTGLRRCNAKHLLLKYLSKSCLKTGLSKVYPIYHFSSIDRIICKSYITFRFYVKLSLNK